MAEDIQPAKRAYIRKKKKPLNYQMTRILKEKNFSPLHELLEKVYPELSARDKKDVIFRLMDYLYAKPKAVETTYTKRAPVAQTNLQINMTPQKDQVPEVKQYDTDDDLVKLLQAAEGKSGSARG